MLPIPMQSANFMTDRELNDHPYKSDMAIKIKVSPSMFLAMFGNNKGQVSEFVIGNGHKLEIPKLKWVLKHFKFFSFNGMNYDWPLLQARA